MATPRWVGQPVEVATNILFVTEAQASDGAFIETFDRCAKPITPWVIGSVKLGVAKLVPPGSDSYTDPTWERKKA